MGGIGRAAADAKNKQPPAALAHPGEFIYSPLNSAWAELGGYLLDLLKELLGKAHRFLCLKTRWQGIPIV
jgi:hypothetical protein